jgi:hypothetical protein
MSSPLDPLPRNSWNQRRARHLINRAGFGEGSIPVSSSELSRMPLSRAVDGFLNFDKTPDQVDEPDFLPDKLGFHTYRKQLKDEHPDNKEKRKEKLNEYKKEHRKARRRLRSWWLKRMHRTHTPLREKLALFWHGHFATEDRKVKNARWNYQLNDIFRRTGAGNLKELTFQVAKSPAMLRYLDNDQNRKKHPNENWSRELMELHTLGLGHYTEDDVLESARAFTGWTIKNGEFHYRESWHDKGEKHFLNQSGDFNGTDIIRIIFQQKPVSGFLALKLLKYFAERKPEPEVIRALAEKLWNENYELKPALRTLFRSRYFYSEQVMESHVKSPVQLVVGLLNHLQLEPDRKGYRYLTSVLKRIGQDLFNPPNVKGWDGNREWVNTSTLLHRYNLPETLIFGNKLPDPPVASLFSFPRANSPEDVLNRLSDHLLVGDLNDDQEETLLGLLNSDGGGQKFNPDQHPDQRLKKSLLVMLSSPEYQIC